MHNLAGGFLVLIKRVGVDIQRGRRLTVSEQSCDRADVRAAGDEQACRRVAQAVDDQIVGQIVRAEDFFEAPCERRRRHRQLHSFSAEHIIVFRQLAKVLPCSFRSAEGFVFAQKAFHLCREIDVAVARRGFRRFHDDLIAGRFDCVATDVDAALGVVDVLPFVTATIPEKSGIASGF